jgi:predicted unusual protein kinase regulating ubiquinone biosynthesis (AarF/ABC1/UbiB family)
MYLLLFQDRVPAFSPEKARAFIEKEMGCSVDIAFKEFEDRPIAAASLGQVLSSSIFQHTHYSSPVPIQAVSHDI